MGLFGSKRRQAVDEPYTPNPDPIYGELDPRLTAPMPQKRGMFGGVGKVLGGVGDVLMYGPFVKQAHENRDYRRRLREAEIESELAQAAKLRRDAAMAKTATVGRTIGIIGEDGSFTPQFTDEPDDTPLIRELKAAGIDPKSEEGRLIIARAARGYQYSPEMQQQTIATQTAIAEARAAATAANRAPTGALTEMQKAELRAQANRAIQAGGDRAAIEARLRQMGVN